jgi:hypothetical protein
LETAPGGGRTHNLWLRRPTLYPVELRAHNRESDYIRRIGVYNPCSCL